MELELTLREGMRVDIERVCIVCSPVGTKTIVARVPYISAPAVAGLTPVVLVNMCHSETVGVLCRVVPRAHAIWPEGYT